MTTGSTLFLITLAIILAIDAVLWFKGKQTITQWHMETVKTIRWPGRLLLLAWGMLLGHLFL